jgi:5-guanidino-2-oxopentanoate decarboxylase
MSSTERPLARGQSHVQSRPLGAQISHMLRARGVDVIFGIPGVHNVELYRGIEEAGITHVLARHEQGAGFMADGYARATGRPGVAYVITGPGLCNIMTPMGQAYSDSVPVLVISSCLNRADLGQGRGRLHEMKDQVAAAACVCDWSKAAMDAQSAYQLVDRALLEFQTARPRPKHIAVPIDVLEETAGPFPSAPDTPVRPGFSQTVPGGVPAYLKAAHRPLFIFGGGVKNALCPRPLLERSGAACFTTYAARGVVGDDYALDFGATLAHPGSVDIIRSADLVIAIGTELSEVDIWRDQLGHEARMIRVDIDPAVLADHQRADVTILAEADEFITVLTKQTSGFEPATGWSQAEVSAARARWRAETDATRPGIVPICEAMKAILPADTMYFSDMTQFAYVAKEVVPMDRPGHWHHPYGFGTLGYALPAAIGGKIGLDAQPVVAIIGDYGFHYTMQELGVAVELGLNIPIILWDNGKLKEIEESMVRAQIAPNAVVARNPDFCALARAFGARAVEPASLAEFQSMLLAALKADGPTLIYLTPAVND